MVAPQQVAGTNSTTSKHVSCTTFVLTLIVSNLLVLQLCQLHQVSLAQGAPASRTWSFSAFLSFSAALFHGASTTTRATDQQNADNDDHDENDFWLAYEHSFGLFTDITNADWKQYYQQPAAASNSSRMTPYRFPNEPNFRNHDVAFWTFFNWDAHFSCPHLVRFAAAAADATTGYYVNDGSSIKAICDPERILYQIHQRERQRQKEQQGLAAAASTAGSHDAQKSNTRSAADSTSSSSSPSCLIYSFGSSTASTMDRFQEQHGWIGDLLDFWADTAGAHDATIRLGKQENSGNNDSINDTATGNLCEIHIFDPSLDTNSTTTTKPDRQLLTRPNVFVHPWKLVSSSSSSSSSRQQRSNSDPKPNNDEMTTVMDHDQSFSFDDIVTQLGHSHRILDILHLACEGCEWYTYRDWLPIAQSTTKIEDDRSANENAGMVVDVRQVLVQTYSLPAALAMADSSSRHQVQDEEEDKQLLQSMNASDFFDAFRQANYVLYAKQVHSGYPAIDKGKNCQRTEWSFLKMHGEFYNSL
jgi:Methyltransferase domain